jgi:putative copper resistance protein D
MFILLTWTHLVAATVWVGGMLFLTLVLVPVTRAELPAGEGRALFRAVALRFRRVVWVAMAVLVSTGLILMSRRVGSYWDVSTWPALLKMKLALVVTMLGVTLIHDFWLGPLVSRIVVLGHADGRPSAARLVRIAPWVARAGLVLGLGVLLAAVALVRT